jgi:hypothetical protein
MASALLYISLVTLHALPSQRTVQRFFDIVDYAKKLPKGDVSAILHKLQVAENLRIS